MKRVIETLGNLMTLKRGYDLPESRRNPGDVPVLSFSGITGSHNQAKVDGPGAVTGRYGTLGKVFYIEDDYWPLNTALYVSDFKGNDRRFTAYFLQYVLRGITSNKAAVPGVNRNDLHARKVHAVRDVLEQRRIATILIAYDDLIENNLRRIRLLEESARLLYREWFVHLRFPGHEHTRIVDGVSEGWEKHVLGDLCEAVRETVNPNELEPDTPYVGLEHIPRRSITLGEWGLVEQVTSTKHRYRENDILFGKIRPYFHKVGFALTDGAASSDAIAIRPVSDSVYALVLLTVSSDEFIAMASKTAREGSKMPRADWKLMTQYSVPKPPSSLMGEFSNVIMQMLVQMKNLAFQNRRLRQGRDLLLPKLMSGEIEV